MRVLFPPPAVRRMHSTFNPRVYLLDRDCAMLLGWVQQVLQTAILRVGEERLSMEEKIAACAAAGKVRPAGGRKERHFD